MVTSCTTGQYHYHMDTYSHYHMGLWYITTQVPVVFHVVTCTTGQYHYHMDTTASCSHYHMGVWYITTQVTVVTEILVVFYVVSCTTGITTQYFCKGKNLDRFNEFIFPVVFPILFLYNMGTTGYISAIYHRNPV